MTIDRMLGRDPSELVVVECDPCEFSTVVAVGAITITSCPDCQGDLEIDETRAAHNCDESTTNYVIVESGETCPFCDEQQQVMMTDGGHCTDGTDRCRECGRYLGAGYLCDDCDRVEVLE